MNQLVLLKLGGSLITDKTKPYSPRLEILDDLAIQIAGALRADPGLKLVVGHGSGSFGHEAASHYQIRQGITGETGWHGFAEVWYQASTLNRLIIEALHRAGLPCLALAPVSAVTAHDGSVATWDLTPLRSALKVDLLPVVYGDVVFDQARGGTILSTEDLFVHLARQLHPKHILLAGQEKGIWADFPGRTRLLQEVTPEELEDQTSVLKAPDGADVTGGIKAKVLQMSALIQEIPTLDVLIFSGLEPGNIRRALLGERLGTILHS
jgi:isopentenyl phosphate kinase